MKLRCSRLKIGEFLHYRTNKLYSTSVFFSSSSTQMMKMVWPFSKRGAPTPRTENSFNSIHQSPVHRDDVAVRPSERKTLPSAPVSSGYRVAGAARAGPTDVRVLPSGRNHHDGTVRHDAYFIPAAQPRTALQEPDVEPPPARSEPRTASSEVPGLNRDAWNSHKALYPQLNEMIARVSIESTEDAALDAAAAMEQVKGAGAQSALSDPQTPQWNPQGEYLTSTQVTALFDAIDGIGNALSRNLSQESIACSIHELEQLLDQARPISRCKVLRHTTSKYRARFGCLRVCVLFFGIL